MGFSTRLLVSGVGLIWAASAMASAPPPVPVSATACDRQFIFVDGILGDVTKSNFIPALAALKQDCVSADVFVIRPDSMLTVSDNSENVFQQLRQARNASSHRSAVLVAHSAGGAESLLMLLHHPELLDVYGISHTIIVQGAIGGSPVVDLIEGNCTNSKNAFCEYLNQRLPAIQSFLPKNIQPLFEDALKQLGSDLALENRLRGSLYYLQAKMNASDVGSIFEFTHLYLSWFHAEDGPNDGAIPSENEKLTVDGEVFGTDLGIVISDHISLLNNTKSAAGFRKRELFFRNLINEVIPPS